MCPPVYARGGIHPTTVRRRKGFLDVFHTQPKKFINRGILCKQMFNIIYLQMIIVPVVPSD